MALKTSRHQKQSHLRLIRQPAQNLALVLVLLSLAFIIFFSESYQSLAQTNQLKVWFFDVGQGDAIFIETPNHHQILIDGGPGSGVLSKLGSVMLPWDKTIDAIIFTHPDADHITGLIPILERYKVSTIYETGLNSTTQTMKSLETAIIKEQAQHQLISAPQRFLIDGLEIQVLWPEQDYQDQMVKEANATSIVLKVTYQNTSILLTGDAEVENEAEFGSLAGDVDVLKIGHHGSLTSTGVEFLNTVTPEIAVISVGGNNRYGHPHPAILQRLIKRTVKIFRTDQDGDILLISDGGEPTVFPAPLPF